MNSFVSQLLRRHGISIVIAGAALSLFLWPMIGVQHLENPKLVIGFTYGSWALVILILFIQSRARGRSDD